MRSITKIILRILSIYFLVRIITRTLPTTISIIINEGFLSVWGWGYIVSIIIFLLIIVFLWKYADKLSNYILDNEEYTAANNQLDIDYQQIQKILITTIGIVIFAITVPEFIKEMFELFSKPAVSSIQLCLNLLGNIIKLLIAGWFVLNSRGVLSFIDNN